MINQVYTSWRYAKGDMIYLLGVPFLVQKLRRYNLSFIYYYFLGLKVMLTYIVGQKRQKRILGIAKDSAEDLKFEIEEGGTKRKISVAEYFKKTYNITLR